MSSRDKYTDTVHVVRSGTRCASCAVEAQSHQLQYLQPDDESRRRSSLEEIYGRKVQSKNSIELLRVQSLRLPPHRVTEFSIVRIIDNPWTLLHTTSVKETNKHLCNLERYPERHLPGRRESGLGSLWSRQSNVH